MLVEQFGAELIPAFLLAFQFVSVTAGCHEYHHGSGEQLAHVDQHT